MEANLYNQHFQAIKPIATEKFAEITKAFSEKFPNLSAGKISQRGDEEFILSLDFSDDGEFALGVDITLADGSLDDDEETGLAIKLEIQGSGGEPLGEYIPENYSDSLYTDEKSVLIHRISSICVDEIIQHLGSDDEDAYNQTGQTKRWEPSSY